MEMPTVAPPTRFGAEPLRLYSIRRAPVLASRSAVMGPEKWKVMGGAMPLGSATVWVQVTVPL
mgnify:CR=1 FL=1